MKITFSDGSFMLSWDYLRAWYNADGSLKGAEYKRKYKGYPVAVAVSDKHTNVIEWLGRQGINEINSPAHAENVAAAKLSNKLYENR